MMRTHVLFCLFFVAVFGELLHAQGGVQGKQFGFGLVLGEPLGATIKYWTGPTNAWTADIGGSWYGRPRIDVDYLWHFNAFKSSTTRLIASPGVVLGLGGYGDSWWNSGYNKYRKQYSSSTAIAIRGLVGVNVIPNKSPFEIFLQLGPLISISPGFYSGFEVALGARFYP